MRITNLGEIQVTCGKCYARLAVTAEDIKDDDAHGVCIVICLNCNSVIYVPGSEIPQWMLREMEKIGA